MKAGDMVYYLYTDKNNNEIKIAASVLSVEPENIHIRVGRFDILSSKLVTFESTVTKEKLLPRTIPCSFEDALNGIPGALD
jgi:hypothetical protein